MNLIPRKSKSQVVEMVQGLETVRKYSPKATQFATIRALNSLSKRP